MEQRNLNADDLVAQLTQANRKSLLCQVTITNETPPEWGVRIGEMGVKFFYRDGTDYTDGPRMINIESGKSAIFRSHDRNRCVHGVFVVARVHIPNEKPEEFIYTYQEVDEKKCIVHLPLTFGEKTSVSQDIIDSDSILGYFEFRIAR